MNYYQRRFRLEIKCDDAPNEAPAVSVRVWNVVNAVIKPR